MSNLSDDDGIRALPMEGLCHQELEKLEDEVLESFTGVFYKNKTHKNQKPSSTTKTKKSYRGVDSVHSSVQSQGVAHSPFIQEETGDSNEQNKEEREKEREGEEEEGREEDKNGGGEDRR